MSPTLGITAENRKADLALASPTLSRELLITTPEQSASDSQLDELLADLGLTRGCNNKHPRAEQLLSAVSVR